MDDQKVLFWAEKMVKGYGEAFPDAGISEHALVGFSFTVKNIAHAIENKDMLALLPPLGWLHYQNKNARGIFEDITGIKLPKTNRETINVLKSWALNEKQ